MAKTSLEWRLRGIPAPLWRRVQAKAAGNLQAVMLGLLRAYVAGRVDPLQDLGVRDDTTNMPRPETPTAQEGR